MASNRTVYHVVPNASADKWLITKENGSFRQEFATKEEAVQEATARAEGEKPSQVKVHKKDGNMDYESTYGEDPRSVPG